MIYVLVPHDGVEGIRVFENYGMMEQTVLRQGMMRLQWHLDPDWCLVTGYDQGLDECVPIWRWYVGPAGQLVREPASRSP